MLFLAMVSGVGSTSSSVDDIGWGRIGRGIVPHGSKLDPALVVERTIDRFHGGNNGSLRGLVILT